MKTWWVELCLSCSCPFALHLGYPDVENPHPLQASDKYDKHGCVCTSSTANIIQERLSLTRSDSYSYYDNQGHLQACSSHGMCMCHLKKNPLREHLH